MVYSVGEVSPFGDFFLMLLGEDFCAVVTIYIWSFYGRFVTKIVGRVWCGVVGA